MSCYLVLFDIILACQSVIDGDSSSEAAECSSHLKSSDYENVIYEALDDVSILSFIVQSVINEARTIILYISFSRLMRWD